MPETMITGIITLIGIVLSGIVSIVVATVSNNKTVALIELRIKNLEDKQDRHNQVIERTYKLEQKVEDLTHYIKM